MAINFTITNATVVPFYRKDTSAPEEILKAFSPKTPSDTLYKICSFSIQTKVNDTATGNSKHFKQVTVFAKTEAQFKFIEDTIKNGAVLQIEGYLSSQKNEKDNKFYDQYVANNITLISGGADLPASTPSEPEGDAFGDDDLPF